MCDHEGTLQIKNDDRSVKTKIILSRSDGNSGTLRFNQKYFFTTKVSLVPYWDHKSTNVIHADSPGVFNSDKVLKWKPAKIHLECDVILGSLVNGLRQPKLCSFVLDKPSGSNIFPNLRQFFIKKQTNLFGRL